MAYLHWYIEKQQLKKVLRETDGLGTEATRASIIELLFKRGFLIKKGRYIQSTEVGRILIHALPTQVTLPDMTAHWEMQLTDISKKQASYQQFMSELTSQLPTLLYVDREKLRSLGSMSQPARKGYAKANKNMAQAEK